MAVVDAVLAQVLAMVRDQGDHGALEEAAARQEAEQAADLAIEIGDLAT